MCGFFGHFNTSNLPKSKFEKILNLSANRGPDHTGYFEGDRVQLGFNRLSILEISKAGNQPMNSPNKRFTLLFNGEVYNHLELRNKLPFREYRGLSDTETICWALDNWGVKRTIESLDGMFAIAIYDTQINNLYLARDFAGVKPLFFGRKNGEIVFSSQYDQIIKHPIFKNAQLDLKVLKLFLKQHFIPAPFGIHLGVYQLKPGELIQFDFNGKMNKSIYWSFPEWREEELISDGGLAVKLLEDELESSIIQQLIADVPLGAFLSGGVDSSVICALAKKHKPHLNVFTIGSDSKKHDESSRSKEIAAALDVHQQVKRMTSKEMLGMMNEAMNAMHEPLADFSILPTFIVSKLARQNATVVLSGDGGDELFYGYERFGSIAKNIALQNAPGIIRKVTYGLDKLFSTNYLNALITYDSQAKAHESLHSRFLDKWINEIAPDLIDVELPDEWNVYSFKNQRDIRELLQNMRKAEFYGMMQKTLRKVDLASMENSLEVRVPFLRKSLIETTSKIDPLLNYGEINGKFLLKEIQSKYYPKLSMEKQKKGFTIPLAGWMRNEMFEYFKQNLNNLTNEIPLFSLEKINNLLENHKSGLDLKWPIYTLFSLQQFHKKVA